MIDMYIEFIYNIR